MFGLWPLDLTGYCGLFVGKPKAHIIPFQPHFALLPSVGYWLLRCGGLGCALAAQVWQAKRGTNWNMQAQWYALPVLVLLRK